jgi:hypothetical protein
MELDPAQQGCCMPDPRYFPKAIAHLRVESIQGEKRLRACM